MQIYALYKHKELWHSALEHVPVLPHTEERRQASWRKALDVFDERQQRSTTLSLFTGGSCGGVDTIQVKLSAMQLRRARPYGNCWLGCELWRQLELDRFWEQKLPRGRESVSWEQVLQLLVLNRLIDPGQRVSFAPAVV